MLFGTFDGIHEGHLNFFQQARNLVENPYLIVSVARNCNVLKIKGKKTELNEKQRILLVQKTKLADKVILAGKNNYLPHILKEKPDIIALGYDQKAYVSELKEDLKKRKLHIKIKRMKAYYPKIYKNHLIQK